MTLIARVLITAIALLIAAELFPGLSVSGPYIAIVAAVLLGVVNLIIRPIIFVLTLPITILTLGLFQFVLNALLFWFVASFVEDFDIDSFLTALLGSLTISVVSAVGSWFMRQLK